MSIGNPITDTSKVGVGITKTVLIKKNCVLNEITFSEDIQLLPPRGRQRQDQAVQKTAANFRHRHHAVGPC